MARSWPNMTRGERNHNPGNIREYAHANIDWVGERATDDDEEFEEFGHPYWGIRALAKVLKNYQRVHGLNTISAIIHRWAPPNENDSGAYVRAVAQDMGIGSGIPLSLTVAESLDLFDLVKAIIRHENGRVMYSDELIQAAIDAT